MLMLRIKLKHQGVRKIAMWRKGLFRFVFSFEEETQEKERKEEKKKAN
jgi:hypothetical protein